MKEENCMKDIDPDLAIRNEVINKTKILHCYEFALYPQKYRFSKLYNNVSFINTLCDNEFYVFFQYIKAIGH